MRKYLLVFIVFLTLSMKANGGQEVSGTSPIDLSREMDNLTAQMHAWEQRNGSSAKPTPELADLWRKYAFHAGRFGMAEEAQTYALKAQEVFMEAGLYGMASLCLYERCIAYNSIGDTAHMAQLLGELADLVVRDTSALTQFNYYSIRFAYLAAIEADIETITDAGRRSIAAVERIANYRDYFIVPAWNYYNQALIYDLRFSPPLTDSIEKYLSLAQASAMKERMLVDRQEAMISIGDERAWLYYYKNDYARAEAQMQHVLALLDSVAAQGSPASIITERGEAYSFFVELYTTQGKYKQALEWQQRLTENNQERYSLDRQRVLDEVQTRYEVEKKEMVIRHQSTAIILLVALGSVALLTLIAVVLAIWYRKRETEEELYAKALEVENMRNVEPIEALRDSLIREIRHNDAVRERMATLDLETFNRQIASATNLSTMDKRYLLCFAAGLTAEQVASVFNVEPASVYTVRYRIKKKFPPQNAFF